MALIAREIVPFANMKGNGKRRGRMELANVLREAADAIEKEERLVSELLLAVRCARPVANVTEPKGGAVVMPRHFWLRICEAMDAIEKLAEE